MYVTGHGMLPSTNRKLSTGINHVKAAHDIVCIEKLKLVVASATEVKTTEH